MQNAIQNINDCIVTQNQPQRGSDQNVVSPLVSSNHNLIGQQTLNKDLNSINSTTSTNTSNPNHKTNNINNNSSPKLNLMAELFESEEEDDDNSEVESFTLDEESVLGTSKFLLPAEATDNQIVAGIHLAETPEIDAESRANLEALLEAGMTSEMFDSAHDFQAFILNVLDKHLIDPDVLRRIASSFAVSDVHCALDEAAAAIAKMRINESQLSSITPLTTPSVIHKHEHSQEIAANLEGSSRLVDDRCSVNEVTEEGESFLSFACSSGHYELAKQLLAARANVEDRGLKETTPLMEASSAGHLNIVKLLLEYNAEVNAQTSQGNTPLMYACAGGHKDVVLLLLKNGANVEDHNENGHTPLMEAASAGHVEVAKILVEHGASINTHSNEFKESALTLACYKGHLEMVRFLLEAGADQEHKTDEMHTALMEASMDGHVEVARLLLDSGAQVNMPADSFESPLTLAACGGHVELAMLLLERGANIEEVNDEGYTPLMEAAREGHEEMVALLLSQGGDINAQTEETQETALTLACCGGFLDVADFLIKAGADIEAGANTPLMEAAQEGHLDLVRHLINSGANVNATTSSGDTALMYACENGHTDVAELLLQAGANLEHEAEGGRTPLMKASRAGHLCTVQFLINRGANVNKVTTNNDHTPLSLACAGGHLAVVELLLANGADPTHRLKDSSTMLIEAAKGGHTTVVQLLIDYPTNLMASSPPVDLSQLTTTSNDPDLVPRVPSHGLQLEDTSNRTHSSVNSIQSKINIQKIGSKKHVSKENGSTNSTNVITGKVSDSVDSYAPFPKGRSVNKVLERSLSDSGASFVPPTNVGISESPTFSSIDALKEAERLEARINDMIRRTDELDPAKEEQIRQKQQILEELQRVEREYQAHWQQQLIQCYQAGLSCPSISQVSTNVPVDTSNITTNVSPHGIPLCLDMSNLQKPFKIGGETPFQIPSPAITQSNIFQPTSTTASTDLSTSINLSVIPTPTSFTSTISSSTNTPVSLPTPPANRRFRSNSKIKNISSKQHSQHQTVVNIPKTTSSQTISTEDVERMNLKNTANLEQLEPPNTNPSTVNQQTQNLLQQQQLILSELAQNFSSRPETLQFLQAAASNIKIDASIPFLLPRLFEPNASNQTSVIQSQQQSQPPQQPLQQSQQQSTQTNQFSNVTTSATASNQDTNKKSLSSKTSKLNKSVKAGNLSCSQQTQQQQTSVNPQQQHMNQMTQTASILQSLTSEQLMSLKNQFAASTATQTDAPSAIQQLSATLTTSAPTLINQTPCSGSENTGGIYSIGAPAFPVPLTLSPVTISPSSTTVSNKTIIQYPSDNEANNSQFVISNPPTTVDTTSVSSGSTPQTSHTTTTPCMDSSTLISPSSLSTMFTNTLTPTSGFEPLSFPNVSTVLTASLSQSANANLSSLASHMSYSLPNTIDSLSGNTIVSNSQDSDIIITTNKSDIPLPTSMTSTTTPATNISIPSSPPWYPPVDLDSQTDSNHDTALTLACAGGHEELVSLLLNRGAEMEHRDKKGFTPLMLAATAGHANVVEIMLNNGADMEAQSERTKDTALSLACSSGRYEVVEILLSRGANKEHRNVSDYTPLSLAASGGYVNIIKLLLSHGAEINSRTGSKLGISPLMLAAMNGHAATVRLLLDMGSDINAQIETNRNTALTLACFQGRCEVVSLLLDRKANVEHRAKTGLTPLMEAASGGYVEVGRVLLDKGADVNAPPVPSSRDTALTIAADKGHYRFVELLLSRGAAVDVKNKKGNSPLWLACNGGHLDVVQLLVNAKCDIDSQDNRKVSCLMAAFRKGHVKVVKWMVKHVNQFPSDQEITRFIALINDKELLKKTNQCAEILRQAKERQAAEANKNATILLEEIDLERSREESRKAAAARRRERKRQKKKEKQEQMKAAKTTVEEKENKREGYSRSSSKSKDSIHKLAEDDDEDDEDDDYLDNDDSNDEDEDDEVVDITPSPIREPSIPPKDSKIKANQQAVKVPFDQTYTNKQKDIEKLKKATSNKNLPNNLIINNSKKTNQQQTNALNTKGKKKEDIITSSANAVHDKPIVYLITKTPMESHSSNANTVTTTTTNQTPQKCVSSSKTIDREPSISNKPASDIFDELTVEMPKDYNGNSPSSISVKSPGYLAPSNGKGVASSITSNNSQSVATKKGQKREEGWKEVVRKSKKVVVPSNAISRVIGRGGCNINTIREISGAHIEVEKQKGQGDRMVIIKGSADATRHAQQLIAALSKETEKDLSEIIKSLGLSRPTSVSSEEMSTTRTPCKSSSTAIMGLVSRQPSNVLKSSSMSAVTSTSLASNVSAFANRSSMFVRLSAPLNTSAPFVNTNLGAWNTKTSASPRMSSISSVSASATQQYAAAVTTKSTVSYTMAVAAKGRNTKTTSVSNIVPAISKVASISDVKTPSVSMPTHLRSTGAPQGVQPFNNQIFSGARVPNPISTTNGIKNASSYLPTAKQPFSNVQTVTSAQSTVTNTAVVAESNVKESNSAGLNGTTPEYTPFNNLFSKVAQASVWGQSKDSSQKPNFASVAASGLASVASSNISHSTSLSSTLMLPIPQNSDQELAVNASKAPGYRGNLHISPSNASLASTPSSSSGTSNLGPIGSGHARSAPCTPPLIASQGPLTPSNSVKMSSPPPSATPTPPPQHSLLHQNRSMTDPQNPVFSLTNLGTHSNDTNLSGSLMSSCNHSPLSVTSIVSSTSVVTSYQPMMNSPSIQPVVSSSLKSQSYNISGINLQRHYVTNTTFSQNTPLTSVGQIQPCNDQNSPVFGVNNNPVQSNLNPNAPDFSARASVMQSSHHMNGPSMPQQNRISSNAGMNASNQTQATTIVLQDQMRAAILAASANLQLHTLQKQQAARMHYAANPALHQNHLAANDFGPNTPPPSPETLRLLHTAINSIPAANLQHFGLMQPSNFLQQRLSQTSINSMNTPKEMESNSDFEERKLPRPIGTERAQRKNPTPVFAQNNINASNDTTQVGMWPFGCGEVVGNDMNEWLQQHQQQQHQQQQHQQQQQQQPQQQQQQQQQHQHQQQQQNMHSSNITNDSSMPIIHQTRYNSGEEVSNFDSTYQMNVGSHVGNAVNFSASTMPMMGMNGVPPHLSSVLYQSSIHPALNSNQDCDYWSGKIPPLSATNTGLGNGMSTNQSANAEQKINWNNWNHHT